MIVCVHSEASFATSRVRGVHWPRCAQDDDDTGFDAGKLEELCKLAFTSPLRAQKPLRITFVVGGGKKVRQKSAAAVPPAVGALRK